MSSRQLVNIILFSLGILICVLLAIVCDNTSHLEKLNNVISPSLTNAHFSVLRTDSVVTDYVIINPVVEVPCE